MSELHSSESLSQAVDSLELPLESDRFCPGQQSRDSASEDCDSTKACCAKTCPIACAVLNISSHSPVFASPSNKSSKVSLLVCRSKHGLIDFARAKALVRSFTSHNSTPTMFLNGIDADALLLVWREKQSTCAVMSTHKSRFEQGWRCLVQVSRPFFLCRSTLCEEPNFSSA